MATFYVNTEGFKITLIYFDTNTQYANFYVMPLMCLRV